MRRIHRWFPHKGQCRGALMFSLTSAWINGWVNNGEAGDLRRHRAHYDGTVMGHQLWFRAHTGPWLVHNTLYKQRLRESNTTYHCEMHGLKIEATVETLVFQSFNTVFKNVSGKFWINSIKIIHWGRVTHILYKLRSVQNTGTCYPGQGWFVSNLGCPGVPDKSSRGLGSMSRAGILHRS